MTQANSPRKSGNTSAIVFVMPLLLMFLLPAAGLGIVAGVHTIQENWDTILQTGFGAPAQLSREVK